MDDLGEIAREWLRNTMREKGLTAYRWGKLAGIAPTTITRAILGPGSPDADSPALA